MSKFSRDPPSECETRQPRTRRPLRACAEQRRPHHQGGQEELNTSSHLPLCGIPSVSQGSPGCMTPPLLCPHACAPDPAVPTFQQQLLPNCHASCITLTSHHSTSFSSNLISSSALPRLPLPLTLLINTQNGCSCSIFGSSESSDRSGKSKLGHPLCPSHVCSQQQARNSFLIVHTRTVSSWPAIDHLVYNRLISYVYV